MRIASGEVGRVSIRILRHCRCKCGFRECGIGDHGGVGSSAVKRRS